MAKTISYVDNGDTTTTLTESWTGPTVQMNKMLQSAGEWYYTHGMATIVMDGEDEVEWDNLTVFQKKVVLLEGDTKQKRDAAYAQYAKDTQDAARDSMNTAEEEFNLVD